MIRKALMLLAAAIVISMIFYANPARVANLLSKSNLSLLFLAFVVSNIAIIFRVMKWKVLAGDASFRQLVPVQLFGMASSNFTPGKIGEPIKAIVLKSITGRTVSSILPSIIWERIIDLAVLIILSIGLFFSLSVSGFYYFGIIGLIAAVALIILLVLFLKNEKAGNMAWNLAFKIPVLKRLPREFIKSFYRSKTEKSSIVYSFVFTACSWILEGFIIYLTFRALGVNLLNPLLLAMIFAFATVLGIISMLPGGLGSTDFVLALLLTSFGAEPSAAITGILISRLLSVWYVNLLGTFSFFYFSRKINPGFLKINS
jgi:uncharacterized protein (TIRG00374 family)